MLKDLTIDRTLRESASTQIASHLRQQIQSNKLKSGQRLPNTAEVVKRLGVGTHTIREALTKLAREGLVEVTPGKGTFISDNVQSLMQKLGKSGNKQKLTRIAINSAFADVTHSSTRKSNSYRVNSVGGIMAECDRLGLAATLLPSQIAYSASPEALHEYLLESNCEGLVWLYPMSKDWAKIEYLSDAGFPVVVTRRSHLASGVASVESDELGAGLIAGNHMVDKGCKKLLVFTYFNEADIDADENMNYPLGFREGLRSVFDRRSDLDSDDIKFVYNKDMEGDNAGLLKDALKRMPDDCGIIASGGSDSFYEALFENTELLNGHELIVACTHAWTVRIAPLVRDANFKILVTPFEEVARCAVQKLAAIIDGNFENTATLVNCEFSDYWKYWHSKISQNEKD